MKNSRHKRRFNPNGENLEGRALLTQYELYGAPDKVNKVVLTNVGTTVTVEQWFNGAGYSGVWQRFVTNWAT